LSRFPVYRGSGLGRFHCILLLRAMFLKTSKHADLSYIPAKFVSLNLTFMGPRIVRIFKYISNKIQRYTVYSFWKLVYMFRVVPSPIISSANNCIYSMWYLSHRYCYLPLSWKIWNWFECAVVGVRSTCFGWYLHPSSGAQTTVSTASGICHTVTSTCRYRGRVGTGLSVLRLAYATHSTLKPVPTLPR